MTTLRRATETVRCATGLYRELVLSSLQLLHPLRELARRHTREHTPALSARIVSTLS